jgi:glycerophosphoryl diester phosphodiesterase
MKPAAAAAASLLRTSGAPIVIAHRGASARVPENTLPAFRAAWQSGAAWVEADTQPTADNVPVILHDDALDRTTTGVGPVRARTAAEVAALELLGLPGVRVPTLQSLLADLTADRAVLLEIKGEHTVEQVRTVMADADASGHDDRVFLQSFELPVLAHIKRIEPARPVGLLVEKLDDDPVARCRELGAVAYNPDYRQVLDHPGVVRVLRQAGIAVAVWTSDDPAEWELLSAAGVDAVITNTPAELLAWQRRRSASETVRT